MAEDLTRAQADEFIAAALAASGETSCDYPDLREGLEVNLSAIARTPLNARGKQMALGRVAHDLANRLRIERWTRENPQAACAPIEGPVLVCGLPRTGTTAAVAMLALDERFRFMRAWEASAPLPPPVAGEEETDPRVQAARAAASSYSKPEMHLHDPDGPEEDLVFTAGFNMRSFHGALPVPDDYLAWWIADDFRSTYETHAKTLRLLQSKRPPYLWLLKAPAHLFKLEAFAAQYPNAKFVMTHRDPRKLIGSVASLSYRLFTERCDEGVLNKQLIGARALGLWTQGMHFGLAARARIGEHRFIDVTNDEVVKTPLAAFERIYDHFGMTFTPDVQQRLVAYNQRNAPGARGAHVYSLEEYGLTSEAVARAFGDYIERFRL